MRCNPAIGLWLHSTRTAGLVAELGSLGGIVLIACPSISLENLAVRHGFEP